MNKIFKIADVAREAIEEYQIFSGDENSILVSISKKISRYIEDNYGKGAKITVEIKDKILSWEGLGGYFKGRADADWKGTRYFEELAKKMQLENNTWINQQIVSQHEDPTVLEIENEIKYMKNSLIDQIMFNAYLNISDQSYHDAYKIIVQNNFDKQLLNFARKKFFKKYFKVDIFNNDFIQYWNRYGDTFNVEITPEMAEALERINNEDSYKYYLHDTNKII